MKPWRRHLRRLRLAFTVTLAALVIAAAVLVGLAQVLLPLVARHPERVAAFLSERVHRPVTVDAVQAQWEGAGAALRLSGVHIAGATKEQPSLLIPQAELLLDFSAWAKENRRWNEFHLRGLDLRIEHAADGQWHIAGFAGDADSGEGDSPLLMLGALVVADTRIAIVDAARGVDLKLKADELRLLNWGSEHTLLGLVRCERDVIEPVQLVARWDAADELGELYVGSEHADLGQIFAGWDLQGASLQRGNGRLRLWATFGAQRIDSVHASFDFRDVAVRSADATLMALPGFGQLPRLAGVARWRRDDGGWNLDVAQLTTQAETRSALDALSIKAPPPTALHLAATVQGDATRYEFSAPELDLATVARLAALAESLPVGLRRWLFEAAPSGHVRAATAQFASLDDFSVSADLADLHLEAGAKKPGLDALSAHIAGDAQALLLHIPEQATTLRWPYKFRQPLAFTRFGSDVVFYRDEAAWNLATDALVIEGDGFGLEAAGRVEFQDDGSKPLLDLAAVVTHADMAAAKLFWPLHDIPDNTIRWLDRALVSGRIAHGRALVRGDLDDWPFRHDEGRFDAVADVQDLTLDYHPEWPRAEGMDAVAEFDALGMHVVANSGRVLGASVKSATADIADFNNATLELDASGSGTGAQLLGFLNASPVGKRNAEHLKPVKVGGKGDIAFHLTQPLKPGDDNHSQLQGKVKLSGADLEDARYNIHFERANGEVSFSEKGFLAGPLDVGYAGHPAKFSLMVGQTVGEPQHQLEATLDADLPLDTLFADVPALKPLWPYFPGAALWHVALSVDHTGADGRAPSRLQLHSDLAGTQILLPAPLAKAAAVPLSTRIDVPLPFDGSELNLAMGDVLRLRAHLPEANKPLAIGIAFGTEPPAQLPASGIAVTGHAALIDIPGWTVLSTGGDQGLPLHSVDIMASEARVGERSFHDLGLRFDAQPEAITLALSGAEAQGTLRIPRGTALAQQGITAQLERLHWPEAPPDETDDDSPGALSGVVPSALPPLHAHVKDLRLGHASFGEMKLEAAPTAQGLRFSEVTTTSPNVQMRAQGDWIGGALSSRSEFSIDLGAQNLGNMLDALGYAGVVDGGETSTHIQASWPGGPSNFALWRLDGTLKLSVKDGRIPEVDPRMGRLFGLISLREIPRRLALDFGDFFRSGFAFNSIDGEFQLRDTSAFTTDLHIDSPSADIRISGRTGLKAKDYDQQMTVVPHVNGTLPVVGAVVGGPAGAAAGLAVQTLFSKVINQATTSRYRITGTWENPVSTLVAREGARGQARKPVPAPAQGKEKAG